MNRVLAISGGVDSMVMLDLMKRGFFVDELVVATFDHGTRTSAKADAEFVSKNCDLRVYKGEAKLGAGVSEEEARKKRYEFLREVAFRERGEIWTAHHLDDLVETVAINFLRGTGVRGLAALNAPGVRRPFLDETFDEIFDKRKILKYAAEHEIVFRQDPTNVSDEYLRNRVRPKVLGMPWSEKMKLYVLWQKQKEIMREIDELIENIIPEDLRFEREWFGEMPDEVAMEILRAALMRAGVSATRPQIADFLKAIREYQPGKKFNLPGDKLVRMGRKDFVLKI